MNYKAACEQSLNERRWWTVGSWEEKDRKKMKGQQESGWCDSEFEVLENL